MKSFRFYLQICLIIIIASSVISCNQDTKDAGTHDINFKLITYNVWYGFTKVPERKEMWLQWMEEQDPDVVSLQELNEYTPEMLSKDAERWGHRYSVLLKQEGFPTGFTSRYPIKDIQKFMEGFHHGLLRVKVKEKFIYIIHLHPSNWETRNREIDFIISDIKGLPQGSQVILAGDFNTFSSYDSIYYTHSQLEPFFNARDEAYNEVNLRDGKLDYSVLDKLVESGLIDLEYKMRTSEYQFTGSFPTLIEKEGEHGDQRRLDYVFCDKETASAVVRSEIIADDVTLKLSDHLPMVVEFKQ